MTKKHLEKKARHGLCKVASHIHRYTRIFLEDGKTKIFYSVYTVYRIPFGIMECHATRLKAAVKNGRGIITMKFMSPHLRWNLFAPMSVGIKPALLSIMYVINYREDIKSTRTSSKRANLFPSHSRQPALYHRITGVRVLLISSRRKRRRSDKAILLKRIRLVSI